MSHPPAIRSDDIPTSRGRGRGRGKSRVGPGKHLDGNRRRPRGRGRPAEFTQRLLLEGERKPDLTEEEAAELEKELREKYGRRKLETNANRYKEEQVELDSDGEPIVEPEVDLSSFLERQRITDEVGPTSHLLDERKEDEDDINTYLNSLNNPILASKKGKVQQIQWDEDLEELNREKNAAKAARDLKERFGAKSEKLRTKPIIHPSSRRAKSELKEAPPLPLPESAHPKSKTKMDEMENFLDDLLG